MFHYFFPSFHPLHFPLRKLEMEQSIDYPSLMPPPRREQIRTHRETIENLQSHMSNADPTISSYLEHKTRLIQSQMNLRKTYIAGFDELEEMAAVDSDHLQQTRERILSEWKPLLRELELLKRSRRGLAQDMKDLIANNRRTRTEDNPVLLTLEEAYSEVMMQRTNTMACAAKQNEAFFNQAECRLAVLQRYNAHEKEYRIKPHLAYCHLLCHWFDIRDVKAAHLVPKSFTSELKPLFGSDETAAIKDPRNGKPVSDPVDRLSTKADYIKVSHCTRMLH